MYYRPESSVAADVIPFYRGNAYQLFYLRDFRNEENFKDIERFGEGTPWYLLETKDFVNFAEKGEIIARGKEEEQDLYVFTGSVIEKDGRTYIFYTGYNPHFLTQPGKNREVVMRAVSTDFKTWEKDHEFALSAPDCFEPHDFRDPFVFYNEETGEYNMLLAARLNKGPSRRRGCTAVAVSPDLDHWKVREKPFYAPDMYYTHECPDLFRMGDWWYLVFSEFTEKCETHYRMAKSLNGPWITPENSNFDNRNFYAAKTVFDGRNRYIIGWNPTNVGNKDFEDTQWGGNIVAHRIVQQPDGQLFVRIPDSVKEFYQVPAAYREGKTIGLVRKVEHGWKVGRIDGFSSLDLGPLRENCRLSFDVTFSEDIRNFYLFLNSDGDNERSYYVGVDLVMKRMTFDRWPRKRSDHPFMLELERQIRVEAGKKYHMDLIKDGGVIEAYFDNKYAMSARINDFPDGTFGFSAAYGEALIENLDYRIPESSK